MSIVIAGYYGFGNAGDELILYAMIQKFRQESPDAAITVLSKNPSETAHRYGVAAVDRWRPWAWLAPLFYASRFVLGGGGLLQESTGPWNHLYYLSLLIVAKTLGCRTEVFSLGVDPIRGMFNRFWTRFTLNHWVDAISVRDEASRQALKRAGVVYPTDTRPDPVFDLKLERATGKSGRIAFAVSPSKANPHWSQAVAELSDLLAKRLDASVDLLVFFPKEDERFSREVVECAAFVPHVRMWENPTDLLSWIPQYDLVIATRFHALALASLSKVPFIGWGNQSKVVSLCREFGKPHVNTETSWNVQDQLSQIASLYQSKNKSVILATRIG